MNYEEPTAASVREHKSLIVKLLRDFVADGISSDEDIVERGYVIEEVGRFMNYLSDRDEDEVITVVYHDGLNCFETLKEKGVKHERSF